MAQIIWTDSNGTSHEAILQDALYFPSSPVNIISIMKLALDNVDEALNI